MIAVFAKIGREKVWWIAETCGPPRAAELGEHNDEIKHAEGDQVIDVRWFHDGQEGDDGTTYTQEYPQDRKFTISLATCIYIKLKWKQVSGTGRNRTGVLSQDTVQDIEHAHELGTWDEAVSDSDS